MHLRHPASDANRRIRAGEIQKDEGAILRSGVDQAPIVHPSRHRQRRDLLDLGVLTTPLRLMPAWISLTSLVSS
jgi:hypothetical protein